MKTILRTGLGACLSLFLLWISVPAGAAAADNPFIGIWVLDEGFQVTELVLRSDGRYHLETRSSDPEWAFSMTERGLYAVEGSTFTLVPYEYLGEPSGRDYVHTLSAGVLTLVRVEFEITQTFQFKPGSREEVLAKEDVRRDLTGTWGRHIDFWGRVEYTFRPGGYYFRKETPEDEQFPPQYTRGRHEGDRDFVVIQPYSGIPVRYELDFYGNTVTLVRQEDTYGEFATYELVAGSRESVQAKAAEALEFLGDPHWAVGLWEIRDGYQETDLVLRPDGYYSATNHTEILRGVVRGRYVIEEDTIRLMPFPGQGIYSGNNGEFGKVERVRTLDYYDGELQFIDLEALSQWVTIARKRAGSQEVVMAKVAQSQADREPDDWHVGIWEVNDPAGWMEFTFRPDGRYIAMAGNRGVPHEVERGRYRFTSGKVTLAPYPGLALAQPRGFDLDYHDGDLFLAGDSQRLVVARKKPGSAAEVIEKTFDPVSMKGERGSILGLWTANLPGQYVELVFREDGQFRLSRCANDQVSHDYGLYSVNMATRSLVYDSRFMVVQNQGLDFYGDTLTIHGGTRPPSTFTVNLGTVDAAIEASYAADAQEALVDAQWAARVPVGPRDPNTVHTPAGDIPADPNPGRIYPNPVVFTEFEFYRKLIPGFVYFNDAGTIRSVPVVNSREWYFFPTGRVLVRFRNHHAGPFYPHTFEEKSDSWGAYRVAPRPDLEDILHIYADNVVYIESDLGEEVEMTLEDGRRHLFWEKDFQRLGDWAAEEKPIPCELPENGDGRLLNTGVSLSTAIEPDEIPDPAQLAISLSRPEDGFVRVRGTAPSAAKLVIERRGGLSPQTPWQAMQTNSVAAGPFEFAVPQASPACEFFRVRVD